MSFLIVSDLAKATDRRKTLQEKVEQNFECRLSWRKERHAEYGMPTPYRVTVRGRQVVLAIEYVIDVMCDEWQDIVKSEEIWSLPICDEAHDAKVMKSIVGTLNFMTWWKTDDPLPVWRNLEAPFVRVVKLKPRRSSEQVAKQQAGLTAEDSGSRAIDVEAESKPQEQSVQPESVTQEAGPVSDSKSREPVVLVEAVATDSTAAGRPQSDSAPQYATMGDANDESTVEAQEVEFVPDWGDGKDNVEAVLSTESEGEPQIVSRDSQDQVREQLARFQSRLNALAKTAYEAIGWEYQEALRDQHNREFPLILETGQFKPDDLSLDLDADAPCALLCVTTFRRTWQLKACFGINIATTWPWRARVTWVIADFNLELDAIEWLTTNF